MNTCGRTVVLCFWVILFARLTMAIGGPEMELLFTKIDYLQDKLQEVEQTMKTTIETVESKFEAKFNSMENSLQNKIEQKLHEVEESIKTNMQQTMERSMKEIEQASKEKYINWQDMLIILEKNDKERIEKVGFNHESSMQTMENTLKKSVEIIEIKTRSLLEDLKNQLSSNITHIQQHQFEQIKSCQETSQTELKKQEELEKTLDILTDSVQNLTTLSDKSNKILEAHFIYPVNSCRHVTKISGRYIIYDGKDLQPFGVLCEQNKFEGGWTVIQHRYDGSVDFHRNWSEYRNGFGSLDGEFWFGLEYVHQLTKNRPHELLVEVKDFRGNYGYAKYNEFEIGDENDGYALQKLGTYSGTAGDSMGQNINLKFSTFDRDNDRLSSGNCAQERHGAWWYGHCGYSNLNGRYQNTTDDWSAMVWWTLKSNPRGMSYSRMMIRDIIN